MSNYFVKNFSWKFLKKLANLNLSLFVLLLIVVLCTFGSIIEQDQALSYYSNYYSRYYSIIIFLGLDHIFYTWWFVLILLIFVLSLLSCTFFTQLPTLKNSRRWKFIYKDNYLYSNIQHNDYKLDESLVNIVYSLVRLDFFVFYRGNVIYAYKGLIGRIAPIFVHFSIVFVLIGSLFSLFSSFMVQELVPVGETFHFKNSIHSGFMSRLPSNLLFYVDDFYIQYNSNQSIKQFFSSVNVYSFDNKSTNSSLIYVNKPLRSDCITMYQTDWRINGIRLSFDGKYAVQIPFKKTVFNENNCWLTSFFINDNTEIFFVILGLDHTILLYDNQGSILDKVYVGQEFYINNVPLTVSEIMASTGIQIKSDPGIRFVYLGFLIMMISSVTSYMSYSQVWISVFKRHLELCGCTNRATLFFDQDMIKLRRLYSLYVGLLLSNRSKISMILR